MALFFLETFDHVGEDELDPTAYPPFTEGDFSADAPRYFNGSVCRFESGEGSRGFYFGWDMPTPNWALEVTINIASKTHLGHVVIVARYDPSTHVHYGLVLGMTDDAANSYIFDDTVDAPAIAAGTVYLIKFDGTDATVLASAAYTFNLATDYQIRFDAFGDQLTGFVNSVAVVSARDNSSTRDGWSFGRWGVGARMIGSGSGSGLFDLDDLAIEVPSTYVEASVAYDEARRLIRWTVPAGATLSESIWSYHLDTQDWTYDDRHVTCMANYLHPSGSKLVLEAGTDGYVYEVGGEGIVDLAGTAIDSEWESAWIPLERDDLPRVLERAQVLVAQAYDLSVEVTVTVAEDPSDPRTYAKTVLRSGWMARHPATIGLAGRWVKVAVRHHQITGDLRLRKVALDVLS